VKNTGGTTIGTATADENGDYTVTIPAGAANPNEQLTVTAKDENGNTSPGTNFTTPADPVIVTAPTVDNVTGNSTSGYTVTGKATAGNTVEIKNTGGTVLGTAIANQNGDFTVILPAGSANPNQQLFAVAKDADDNQSSATSFTTPADPVTVTAPTVDEVTGNSTSGYTVTGTAPADSTVKVKNTGGTTIGTATADENGAYTVTIPAGAATPNEQLTATAKDADGNTSPGTKFTTPADPTTIAAPTVDSVTGNSTSGYTVTGKATAGNTVEIRNTGGTVLGSTTADGNGDYTITLLPGSANPNQQLSAVAKDGNNTSASTPFTTPSDPVTISAPTVDQVTGNSTDGYTVTGTAPGGSTIEVTNNGGTVVGTTTADGNGDYTLTIPAGSATPNEQLTATAKDEDGNTSPGTNFTTPADPVTVTAPTVDEVTGNSTDGYTVTGTAPGGSTVEVTNNGGTVVGTTTADENGDYTITLPAGSATPREQLSAIAKDDAGNTSSETLFMTPADSVTSEIAAPTVDDVIGTSMDGYTVTGKATAGHTVEIRNANSSILGTAVVSSEGNYSVMIPEGLATANEQLQAVAKNSAGNMSSATPFVTPADPDVVVATPIIDRVEGTSLTGYTVYGKATPNNRVEIYNSDQQLLGQATASAIQPAGNEVQLYRSFTPFATFAPLAAEDGTFVITIPVGLASANEQLQAIAKDDANNQSSVALFSTPADPDSGNGNGNNNNGNGSGTGTNNGGNTNNNGSGNGMNNTGTGTGNNGNGTTSGGTGTYRTLGGSQKNLPNNGETPNNWGILGAIVIGALGLFSFKRRNKE
jgi:LPXTG-motif cell wall-anchored protein